MTNKIYFACMIAMLVISIIAGGCSKNDSNNPQEPAKAQKYHMVVSADKAQDHPANTPRRVLDLDGTTVNASWAAGEEVTVYNVTKNTAVSGVLIAQSSGARTTLSGDLTGIIEPSDILTLKFLSPDYTGQDGTLEHISAHCDYAEASVTVASVSVGNITSTADAVFENKQAVVRFTLMDKADGSTLLNPTSFTINDGTNDIVTLADIPAATYTTNGNGVLFVSIPGFADKTITLSATVGSKVYVYEKPNVTFVNGNYYPITVKVTPEGALPYGFSVSPTKRVLFSKGNLQYNAALGTHQCADGKTLQGTWRFAEHQWDYVGDAIEGTVYENDIKCNNELISSTYNGWIDLFGWGTSGWNSGANNYQPWSYSDNNEDYYVGGGSNHDLINDYAYADWGVYNAISNGGNSANSWRTLTNEEWDYLLFSRLNAYNFRGQATVNEVHGYVLLPDNWIAPLGLNFSMSPNNWTTNVYSNSNWEIMEKAGAIFLPAPCGRGRNVYFDCIGENGSYRTASCNGENRTSYFRFYSDDAFLHHHDLYYGFCVRLAQDVE